MLCGFGFRVKDVVIIILEANDQRAGSPGMKDLFLLFVYVVRSSTGL